MKTKDAVGEAPFPVLLWQRHLFLLRIEWCADHNWARRYWAVPGKGSKQKCLICSHTVYTAFIFTVLSFSPVLAMIRIPQIANVREDLVTCCHVKRSCRLRRPWNHPRLESGPHWCIRLLAVGQTWQCNRIQDPCVNQFNKTKSPLDILDTILDMISGVVLVHVKLQIYVL